MGHTDVEAVCGPAPTSPLGRFIAEAVPFYIEFYERSGEPQGAAMHDPLALAVAIDPRLATIVTTRVEVETDGTWTRGETVADLRGIRRSPWRTGWEPEENARVATGVDEGAFTRRFLERLRSLVGAQA
jgi:purine nucleosidase